SEVSMPTIKGRCSGADTGVQDAIMVPCIDEVLLANLEVKSAIAASHSGSDVDYIPRLLDPPKTLDHTNPNGLVPPTDPAAGGNGCLRQHLADEIDISIEVRIADFMLDATARPNPGFTEEQEKPDKRYRSDP